MRFPATLLLVLAVSSFGCGGGTSSPATQSSTPATVTGVTVTCAPTTVPMGSTSACSAMVTGTGAVSQTVSWSATAGTVNKAGVFTATAAGTAAITATSSQDATKSGSANLTIASASATVSSVTVSCAPTAINVGAASTCTAIVTGSNSPSQSVTWTANGGSITSAGVFTASAVGASTITAASVADPTKSGTRDCNGCSAESYHHSGHGQLLTREDLYDCDLRVHGCRRGIEFAIAVGHMDNQRRSDRLNWRGHAAECYDENATHHYCNEHGRSIEEWNVHHRE